MSITVQDAQTGAELKVREVRAALANGWTPTVPALPPDPAMVAPTVQTLRDEGSLIAAEMVAGVDRKPGWPVWLDELHHLHKVDTERWTRLHQMLAESEARTGTVAEASPEPVAWPWAEYHDVPGGRGPTIADYADSMAAAPEQGEAFLQQGPAPDDSMAGRHAGDREPLNKLVKRVPTAISATKPEAAEPEPDGYVSDTWWARALVWISGRKRGL